MTLMCALCKVQQCERPPEGQRIPTYCPMHEAGERHREILEQTRQHYLDQGQDRDIALASARTEAAGYLRWPRVQEVMEFARRIGAQHLGIASCIGLIEEARLLQKLLQNNGFEVSSVCCKVGSVAKLAVGLRPEETLAPQGGFDPLCNPIGQAQLLNAAGTQLNVLVGLCVGHDSLFFKYSEAPVTVLVAKDRVTGHNPAAALYTLHSYYERLQANHPSEAREG